MIFYLNQEEQPREVSASNNQTVLQYLRHHGWLGSKEGCASGDCGACTAVLVELSTDNRLCYTAVNTCILFLSALHGKLLITVDGISDNHSLHPVQNAMVNAHASQCGFCTPGFVMSLFAMSKHPPAKVSRENVAVAIAGNLCRCTGYRPIIDAGIDILRAPNKADVYDKNQNAIVTRLQSLKNLPTDSESDDFESMSIHIAKDEAGLQFIKKKKPHAKIFAGGTDLALDLSLHEKTLPNLIDISGMVKNTDWQEDEFNWILSATMTITDCLDFFKNRLPAMVPYLHRFGSVPIRSRATLGGNIGNASPIADMPPVLLALNTNVLMSNGTQTRILPLNEFFLDYKKTALSDEEWITSIVIPRPAENSYFNVYKISKRIEDDISIVAAAFYWEVDCNNIIKSVRLAFGGMAAIPKRAYHTEDFLVNKSWTKETFSHAEKLLSDDFTPISDMRASNRYRQNMAQALLYRSYLDSQESTPRIESIDSISSYAP